ncbi:hypothetical protein A9Z42_0091590 [Trichoderma parareesei]|uniref:Uncharacterized protein n=1 Tax=Trichoderma parareesei TaxID=858221 RepID=A0A2H3A6G0_TRIPA|nr:hypothetical protein A9Z42_0091590 [Trichoderma parareesei]
MAGLGTKLSGSKEGATKVLLMGEELSTNGWACLVVHRGLMVVSSYARWLLGTQEHGDRSSSAIGVNGMLKLDKVSRKLEAPVRILDLTSGREQMPAAGSVYLTPSCLSELVKPFADSRDSVEKREAPVYFHP